MLPEIGLSAMFSEGKTKATSDADVGLFLNLEVMCPSETRPVLAEKDVRCLECLCHFWWMPSNSFRFWKIRGFIPATSVQLADCQLLGGRRCGWQATDDGSTFQSCWPCSLGNFPSCNNTKRRLKFTKINQTHILFYS